MMWIFFAVILAYRTGFAQRFLFQLNSAYFLVDEYPLFICG